MKRLWLAAAALLTVETAAIACSCMTTDDPAQLRQFAADAANGAVALVEAETIVPFSDSKGAGDLMRTARTLAGTAPTQFRVERGPMPSSASCDVLPEKGSRTIFVLYPSQRPSAASERVYRISGLCTGTLIGKPAFQDELIRRIGARAGERG